MTDGNKEPGIQLFGWILFLVCAGFFIASSIESGSLLSLLGSIVFLVACFVFMYPLVALKQ
jgi:hypothetical protein